MAVGSDSADAVNRLNSERYFTKTPISKDWYQWQWTGSFPNRKFSHVTHIPKELNKLYYHCELRFVGGEGFTAFICFACPESWLIISGDSSTASNAAPVTSPSS
jgi:hypothetical protein